MTANTRSHAASSPMANTPVAARRRPKPLESTTQPGAGLDLPDELDRAADARGKLGARQIERFAAPAQPVAERLVHGRVSERTCTTCGDTYCTGE
jgi:hypothetical protein